MLPLILWQSGRALLRQFAVLSLIVIGLITATLCLVISYALRRDMLEREWGLTADYIRTEARQRLRPSDFASPLTQAAQEHFRDFYRQAVMMPEIVRVKVYGADMGVVWSDERRLIGQRFPDNPQLVRALAGNTVVNLETGDRMGENVFEGHDLPQLVEVYVPIVFPGDTRVAGVAETYKMPGQVFANIRRGQLTVVSTALTGAVLLYLSLFWIVRRAARRIDEQHQTLETRGAELASANQELRAVQGQLLEAERMAAIGEVVTAVAHGIRNPLANIRASAQVTLLDCKDCAAIPPAPKHLTNIMAEVDRLERRIKELLQFVRPAERQTRPIDLPAMLRGIVQGMDERRAKAGIAVEERFASDLPAIAGDAMLLEQAFLSLLGNAIDAISGPGGTITVAAGLDGGNGNDRRIFVEVRDTGVGIAPEETSKIFGLFYTTKAQGTGIGLALAKKFVEAHSGRIAVRSRPGAGSAFRVTLPVHQPA